MKPAAAPLVVPQSPSQGWRPLVLLVEDDDPVRDLIGRALSANGFEVVAAATGEEALELEALHRVDLLLSDVMLPALNGFQVANRIRARSPHIPVLFMSGYYDQAVAEAANLDITSTILQKPFAMADLMRQLREACPPGPRDARAAAS